MENVILHSTTLKDFQTIIGQVVEEKLKEFKPQSQVQQHTEYGTRKEVCTRLHISLATLHYYTKDGTLNGYRIGGRVLYRWDEVEQSIQKIQASKYKHERA